MKKPLFIARQGRQPQGWFGYIVAWIMAEETAGENRETLKLLDLQPTDNVLEVGFGHGRTLARAAETVLEGRLAGIDFSDVMVDVAARRNRCAIAGGRMELSHGDSASLPYADNRFDKTYSVHTVYFWPDPARQLGEIFRVLKPGGRMVLGFRSTQDAAAMASLPREIYQIRAIPEIVAAFQASGFIRIRPQTEPLATRLMTWIVAQKPHAN